MSAFLSARQLLSKKRGLFMRYFYRKIDPQNRNSETKKAFRRLSGKPEIPYFFSKKALTFSRILLYWYLFRNGAWDGSSAGMSVRLTRERSWVRAPSIPLHLCRTERCGIFCWICIHWADTPQKGSRASSMAVMNSLAFAPIRKTWLSSLSTISFSRP